MWNKISKEQEGKESNLRTNDRYSEEKPKPRKTKISGKKEIKMARTNHSAICIDIEDGKDMEK